MNKLENSLIVLEPDKENLVIKFNCLLRAETMQKVRDEIMEQVKTGVVVIPPYCTAIIVNKNSSIEVEIRKDE